jgi:hypothetical protein
VIEIKQYIVSKSNYMIEIRTNPMFGGGLKKQLTEKNHQITLLEEQLRGHKKRLTRLQESLNERKQTDSVKPENVVWIFGAGRTGSTWLAAMLRERLTVWNEPLVGELFGYLYYVRAGDRRGRNFVLGGDKRTWLPAVRSFVLQVARAKYPDLGESDYLAIKEPNGSIGAPLLSLALPESRIVFLVRDPRDVAASNLDAFSRGKWAGKRSEWLGRTAGADLDTTANVPDAIVRESANRYLLYAGNTKQAYDAHEGYKVLIRYEDLRADTLGTLKRLYTALEIPLDERELTRAVEKHAWENIPEEDKGEGKFYRKASPGAWKVDLSPEQAKMVEHITAPLLDEFYHT